MFNQMERAWNERKSKMTHTPSETEAKLTAVRLRDEGKKYTEIAEILNAQGVVGKKTGKPINWTTVAAWMKQMKHPSLRKEVKRRKTRKFKKRETAPNQTERSDVKDRVKLIKDMLFAKGLTNDDKVKFLKALVN